jgi:hypothetical protein
MTSGGLYLEGCAQLDDPQVLMKVQEKADAKLAEEPRKVIRHYE